MGSFTVTPTELENAAKKIEENIQLYEQATANAKTAADDLAGKWEGDAQVAFVQEQEQANAWYKQMATIVKTYSGAMRQAAKTYVGTDNQAKGIIAGG